MVRWLVLLLVLLVAAPLHAQPSDADRGAAREIGKEALEAYRAGDYDKALELFRKAHMIVGLTTTGLYQARCLEKLGRLVEAAERYLEVSRMPLPDDAPPLQLEAKQTAEAERELVLPRIPRLTIVVGGEGAAKAVVTLDGAVVPPAVLGVARPTDPGDHVVRATAGDKRDEKRIQLAEGASETVELSVSTPSPEPPPPPPPPDPEPSGDGSIMTTLGWVAIGVGGAGLVVGAITGGLAVAKRSELDNACPDKQCPPPLHGDVESYQKLRIVSGVGLIAGGVLAAAGIVLVVIAPTDEETAVTISPTGLALSGRF